MPADSEQHRLRVAVAGLGRWGSNYLATLSRLPGCKLVAGADPNRAGAAGCTVPVFDRLADLLCQVECDAVVVASPDRTHYALARQALLAGRHVLVEKPMALTTSHAEDLAQLARTRGRVLAVGHTMVYHEGFRTLQAMFTQGTLGDPIRITAVRTSGGAADSAGVLFDLVPHDLAMTTALLGPPLAARGRTGRSGQAVSYQLLYPKDIIVSGWAAWSRNIRVRRFRVTGTQGTAVFADSGPTANKNWTTLPLTRQCADFIRACRSGKVPCAGPAQGVLVARCLAALARSGSGTWVTIDRRHPAQENRKQASDGAVA
jgi:predicted dehydrogenase